MNCHQVAPDCGLSSPQQVPNAPTLRKVLLRSSHSTLLRTGKSALRGRHQSPLNRNKIVRDLLAWFGQNARDLPWRKTTDPYAIWVSEIMLQQTQVKTVLGYWDRWMSELPTLCTLANATPDKVHKLWEG